MNDAKPKVQKKTKPKADKAPAKTAGAKPATAKAAKSVAKKTAKPATKPAAKATKPVAVKKPDPKPKTNVVTKSQPTVFRVDPIGGQIREVTQADAIKDILETKGDSFNQETIQALFDKGDVAFSEFYNYSTNAKKLSRWEKVLPDVPAAPKPKDAVVGDVLFNFAANVFGELIDADGVLKVHFNDNGTKKSKVYKADKWRLATEQEADAYRNPVQAIAVKEVDIIPPMTDAEKTELAEREAAILDAKQQFESAPWLMAANLREIFSKRLNRETLNNAGVPMSNGDYAFFKFGITREYAQNLAQLGEFRIALVDGVKNSAQMEMSINAANKLVRGTNQLAKGLGAGELKGFDALRPVIKNIGRLLFDIAPKDKDGNAEITPRLVDSLNATIGEIVKSDSVTIDGKSMKLSEAREKGLLSASVQTEILEKAAEGILSNREIIRSEAKKSYDASNVPQKPVITVPTQFYTGVAPDLMVSCSLHNSTKITSIGTGKFQTKCGCRWLIDNESGSLRCFEVKGKTVKVETEKSA